MASERSRRRGMLAIGLMLAPLAAGCGPSPGERSVAPVWAILVSSAGVQLGVRQT